MDVPNGASIAKIRTLYEKHIESATDDSPAAATTATDDSPAATTAEVFEDCRSQDTELEALRLQLEIKKMELALAQLRIPAPPERACDLRLADVGQIIGKFDGQRSVDSWLQELESVVRSSGGDERFMYLAARAQLHGPARLYIESAASRINDYTGLRNELVQRFRDRRSVFDVYERLKGRTKKSGEDVLTYVTDMECIAAGSIPPVQLIPMIIAGLGEKNFSAMLVSAATMGELYDLLPAYERIVKLTEPVAATARSPGAQKDIRCFNCSKFGHMASKCSEKKRTPNSCFGCGATDHMINACPKRKVAAIRTTDAADETVVGLVQDGDGTVPFFNNVSCSINMPYGLVEFNSNCILDSGSPITLIEVDSIPAGHPVHHQILTRSQYTGLGGDNKNECIHTFGIIKLKLKAMNLERNINAFVIPPGRLPSKLLLGRDSMELFGLKLVATESTNSINPSLFPFANESVLNINYSGEFNIDSELSKSDKDTVSQVILSSYVAQQEVDIEEPTLEMQIDLQHKTPISFRPRRLSYEEKKIVKDIVDDLLLRDIIQPSKSPYAFPIVLVKKKSGETRMCIDYRQLNKITIRDNFPLPLIEDCLDYLSNKTIFTLLDMKSGFNQVKMNKDSIKYTAFVTPDGHWEYKKMPFGLRNAPAVFQRFVNNVFREFTERQEIVVYLDDILLASSSLEEHLELLERVLKRISKAGLELNTSKCKFAYREIEYLGYVASSKGITPGKIKTEAIKNFPTPTSSKEVESFVGLCSYFRRFIKNFSTIARPLHKLKNIESSDFVFDSDCQVAFNSLKTALSSVPVLSIYDPLKETELHTDASAKGFGAVLMQRQADDKMHPVAYFSKTTSPTEYKYHSYMLETLAIYYALERFRVYLEGIHFTIVTDCNSLVLATEKKEMNRSIGKWLCELMRYDYVVRHRPGANMAHVDALSRAPIIGAIDYQDTDIKLKAMQMVDKDIITLKNKLEMGPDTSFEMRDGVIYRKMENGDLLFYVPQDMEQEIIRVQHEKAGHSGSNKTYGKIRDFYWFPKMKEKTERFIKSCIPCILYSQTTKRTETNLHSIPKIPLPFHTIHIDHFGPLPALKSKRKHLLVVIDSFTKYVRLYAVNSTSTKEVICALSKYFEYYSRPVRLVSDRGSCFTSAEFGSFLERLSITHIKTAVAAPQANGQVERVNRVIKGMLGKVTEPIEHSNWVAKIKDVEFAINNTSNRCTGESPSVLLFGINQRGQIVDPLTELLEEQGHNRGDRDLLAIRNRAEQNILKSQEYARKWYDEHSRGAKIYNVGDLVYIRNIDTTIGSNKKFVSKFKGPYIIDKCFPNDRYCVKDVEGCQLSQLPYDGVIEAKNIRLWKKVLDTIIE